MILSLMDMDLMDQIRPFWESLRLEAAEVDRIQLAPSLVLLEVQVVAVRGMIQRFSLAEQDRKGMRAGRVIQHNLLQAVVAVLQALVLMQALPQETADFLVFT
jgi:hypothetical protein